MESFFSSMKTERMGRKVYRTRDQARADVFDYIERFYNPTRRHSTLGQLPKPRTVRTSAESLGRCPSNRQQPNARLRTAG
jgi:transposase InsO family protein